MASLDSARAAKGLLATQLEGAEHVNGVGIARQGEDFALKVNLDVQRDAAGVEIPNQVDGVPVIVEHVGPIRPL